MNIKKMFSKRIKVQVTQEMITEGRKNLLTSTRCIGGLMLKKALPEMKEHNWYSYSGNAINNEDVYFKYQSTDFWGNSINMMILSKPRNIYLTEKESKFHN